MNYRWLLFDADDTLFDFLKAEHQAVTNTLRQFGLPDDEETVSLYSRINAALWLRFDHGEITRARLLIQRFEELLEALGKDGVDPAQMNHFYMHALAKGHFPFPGALELCRDLHRMGYLLAIITNGASIPQHGRLDHSPLREYWDGVFISDDMGCQKPQPEYFDQVCRGMGISDADRKHALIIGDSLSSDMKGGLNAGIDTCWYNPKGKAADPMVPVTYEVRDYAGIRELLGE